MFCHSMHFRCFALLENETNIAFMLFLFCNLFLCVVCVSLCRCRFWVSPASFCLDMLFAFLHFVFDVTDVHREHQTNACLKFRDNLICSTLSMSVLDINNYLFGISCFLQMFSFSMFGVDLNKYVFEISRDVHF